ncbi:MAG: hypothetical protein IJ274_10595 [Lachnospiraceae bacterium]|nr:hypothetical protein [Lachnospiraceae bacterium]
MKKEMEIKLDKFYKDFFQSAESKSGQWFFAGILELVVFLVLGFSYSGEIMGSVYSQSVFLISLFVGWLYIGAYMVYGYGSTEKEMFDVLSFQSVSGKQIRNYWCKKLAFFQLLLLPLQIVFSCVPAFVMKGELQLENFMLPVVYACVLPFFVLSWMVCTKAKKYAKKREVLYLIIGIVVYFAVVVGLNAITSGGMK